MRYEGYLGDARSVSQLDQMITDLSRDGFRIVNVVDRSNNFSDRFLIVAQKDVDAQIHVGGDRPRFAPEPRLPRDRDPSKNP